MLKGFIMEEQKKRVVIGMSGGVDSSVSAYLLQQQGYEVHGVTFGILKTPASDALQSAREVAQKLGISHQAIDLHEQFADQIIEYFKREYLNGRTPNPCVVCNAQFKWASLLSHAETIGAGYVATGHYADIKNEKGFYRICSGKDSSKEQTYMLWMLPQEALSKTLFPLTQYTKPEVREIARQLGLKNADREDSFEICFIPDDDYAGYLKTQIPVLEKNVSNGEIIDQNGNLLGYHKGYPFYTIGQRRRLGISTPAPVYVTGIDPKKNQIRVGPKEALFHKQLRASQTNWFIDVPQSGQITCQAKIRYKDTASDCSVTFLENNQVEVCFDQPKRAITTGQAIVFYDGACMIGGGFIDQILT